MTVCYSCCVSDSESGQPQLACRTDSTFVIVFSLWELCWLDEGNGKGLQNLEAVTEMQPQSHVEDTISTAKAIVFLIAHRLCWFLDARCCLHISGCQSFACCVELGAVY